MTERPILFSSPMVRAILEGRKGMTRRVVTPQPFLCPKWGLTWEPKGHASNKPSYCERNVNWNPITEAFKDFYRDKGGSPYGQPGDRLWVKETWQHSTDTSSRACVRYRANGKALKAWATDNGDGDWEKVDGEVTSMENPIWKPSIFMPRWASRITLEIAAVRVERVQDITQEDAYTEGVSPINTGDFITPFGELWDSINTKRGYGWDKNPWVWVISFKRV